MTDEPMSRKGELRLAEKNLDACILGLEENTELPVAMREISKANACDCQRCARGHFIL